MKRILCFFMAAMSAINMQAAIEPGKTYRIVSANREGASLFVKNASLVDKAEVVIWTNTDVPAQQWTVLDAGNGEMLFRNVYTGKYLDASNMSLTQRTEPCSWMLVPIDEAQKTYQLKLQKKYLRVLTTTDGAQPLTGTTAQGWRFEEVEPQNTFDVAARRRMIDGFLEQYVQFKGQNYRTFMNGGWGEAETMEAILDCYEATKEAELLTLYEQCYRYMRYHVGASWNGGTVVSGYDWFGYDFNDDVMWLIIAAIRGYQNTGKQMYLDDAKRNFDLIYRRAYLGYVGMLRWAENSGDRNGSNSCINGPAEVAACYIAAASGDESYYEKARELYENQRQYLFNTVTGHVDDSVVFNPDNSKVVSRNTWASTYNQGTMLGAAVLLYRHYQDSRYKQDADRILAFAKRELCNEFGVVHVCQNADGDFQGFKGILMRYAGLYAREFQDKDTQKWLIGNAFHAYNNLNSLSFGHSAWQTKAAENHQYNGVDYSSSACAFGASTALSAACAVPLDHYYGDDTAMRELPTMAGSNQVGCDARWYTLQGTSVEHPQSGRLYIHGGKKHLVRQ
ncbi:glycoside hydrolase family 76 protein [Prevotella sp. P6B4]|uniref:glycoside hydrolase family 76 protein n=1 Tax=Prevotella sp. P6B4 TaxID=1410614 RepID=UPI0009DE6FED|nr:glycoside hydrolase family 76 protein [Prevotella sp. P6B4]